MRELTQLRDLLASLSLDADRPGLPVEVRRELLHAAAARQALVDDIDAIFGATEPAGPPPPMPVVAAVLGPSGAGKSTLINRLVGQDLVPTGDLRPTTTGPVWVCSPTDRAALGTALEPGAKVLDATALPTGLTLVEHPDPGVTAEDTAVPVADLYLVVVSPTRYADRRVWELLESLCARTRAVRPGLARIALVLTRLPDDEDEPAAAQRDTGPMIRDVTRRLAEHAVQQVMVVALPDRQDAVDNLRENLWAYAESRQIQPEDDGQQRQVEDALLRLVGTLEERLRPILGLQSAVTLAAASHEDRVDQVVADQQSVWAAEAWRACREDEQITGLLAALQLQAPDGRRISTALHDVAAEVWERMPTVLALATRRHTRSMQQTVAALDTASAATVSEGSVSEATVSEGSGSEATGSEATVPEATVPEATGSEATGSEATMSKATVSEATMSGTLESDALEPDAQESEAQELEASPSDTPASGASVPGTPASRAPTSEAPEAATSVRRLDGDLVVAPGRASSHIRSLGTGLQAWLTETAADLALLEEGNPSPLPHSVAALGVVLSTIGTAAGGERGLEDDGTTFLDQLVLGQIASQLQVEGEAQSASEVADDLRQVCSNRLGRLLRTSARSFLDRSASAGPDPSMLGQSVDVAELRAAALDVSLAEKPTVAADPVRS